MASKWKSPEDVMNDLWLYSEISDHDVDVDEPTPEPILQWNARIGANHNVSIFDTDLPHEEVIYLPHGRGRGGIIKSLKPVQDDEEDIKRRLREVSGFGYSNELIEKHFKKKKPSPSIPSEVEFCDIPEEDSVIKRTPELFHNNSPIKFISNNTTNSSRGSTPSFYSASSTTPKKEKLIETQDQNRPLPLSQILRRAKEKTSNDIKNNDKEENNIKENTSKKKSPLKSDHQKCGIKEKSILRPEAPVFTPTSSLESIRDNTNSSIEKSPKEFLDSSSSNADEESYQKYYKNETNGYLLDWKYNSPVNSSRAGKSWKSPKNDFYYSDGERADERHETGLSWRTEDRSNRHTAELSWRNHQKSGSDLSWRTEERSHRNGSDSWWRNDEPSYKNESDSSCRKDDNSYRNTGLSWRNREKNDKIFDISSDSEFPTLI